jgi:hypothetical protein
VKLFNNLKEIPKMIYRDETASIKGIYNRSSAWTSKRHVVAYGENGVADVEQYLRDTPKRWSVETSKTNGASKDWDLNSGYEGALRLAKDGWPQGAEMIDKALHAIIPAAGREARWGYSYNGGSVNVGRYLTGHPKAMRNRRKKQSGAAPVLHLVVNTVASCQITGQQMANYGAAITGLIDRLETTGKRIHLDMVMVIKAENGIRLSMGWNVKRASEHVDLSQVAFAIAHPAAFRRLGFAMMERTPQEAQCYSYGYSCDALPCDVPDHTDGTMIVDGVNHSPTRCNNPKDALRYAIEQLNKAAVLAGHATPEQPLIPEDEELFAY